MNEEVRVAAKEALAKSFDVKRVDEGYNSVEANFPYWADDPFRIELPPRQKEIDVDPVIKTLMTQKGKNMQMNEDVLREAIADAKAVRLGSRGKMDESLEKEFAEKLKEVTDDENVSEDELDELIEELENEDSPKETPKEKSSFIQDLVTSWHRDKINGNQNMRCRFQKLAGIVPRIPPATLTIGDTTVGLSEIPHWYDVLKYKLCGFKYRVTRQCQ